MYLHSVTYRGLPGASYHGNSPAEVLGVRWAKPSKGAQWRLCFWLRYANGDEDFAPVEEAIQRGFVTMPTETRNEI